MAESGNRGRASETLAAAYLELIGMTITARNVRLAGVEIDLVAIDRATHVLIEVKFRGRGDYGGPEGAIDSRKRSRLLRAANALHGNGCDDVRIDVVAVERSDEGVVVRHHRGAVTG